MSRHFASYSSVALETIWLHEPRDLIFLGPLMTLLCLSSYSKVNYVEPLVAEVSQCNYLTAARVVDIMVCSIYKCVAIANEN